MIAAEKIYYAKKRWKCSFEELAYLLDMDRDEVMELYRQESIKELPKITIDGSTDCLNLSERTKNCLKRKDIRTIRDLITFTGQFEAIRGCGKQSLDEIAEARSTIATVLHLDVPALIAAFASGAVNVEIRWMDNEPNYGKVVKEWAVEYTRMNKVESISGRMKGWMKTILIDVWLNQLDQE